MKSILKLIVLIVNIGSLISAVIWLAVDDTHSFEPVVALFGATGSCVSFFVASDCSPKNIKNIIQIGNNQYIENNNNF